MQKYTSAKKHMKIIENHVVQMIVFQMLFHNLENVLAQFDTLC